MIHVMVRSITVGNIFHCQSSDELDDAGITRLEHPVDLLLLFLELLNKRVDNDLYGIEHCTLHSSKCPARGEASAGFGTSAPALPARQEPCWHMIDSGLSARTSSPPDGHTGTLSVAPLKNPINAG